MHTKFQILFKVFPKGTSTYRQIPPQKRVAEKEEFDELAQFLARSRVPLTFAPKSGGVLARKREKSDIDGGNANRGTLSDFFITHICALDAAAVDV